MKPLIDPLHDAPGFARRLREHLGETPLRQAAAQAGVAHATLSRACNADPNLSHENFLRLSAWLDGQPLAALAGRAAA